jgi:hypothetical protein
MDFMPFCDMSDAELCEIFPTNGVVKHDKDGAWIYYRGVWYMMEPSVEGVWAYVNGEWTFGEWVHLASIGWKFESRPTDQVYDPYPDGYPDDYEDPRDLD